MILCVGTTPTVQRTMIFERLAIDEVNRAAEVFEYASGKSINVARVLRALGEPALATGFAGGARGEFLLHELTREGIGHEFIPIDRETRLCTTLIDRARGTVTELVEEAPPASAQQWAKFIHLLDESLEDVEVVVFSGTLAGGAPDDLFTRCIGRGPRIILDARGTPLRLALDKPGCIVKINRHELAQTLGIELADEAAAIQAIRRSTPPDGMMLITLGRNGLLAGDGQSIWRVRGPEIQAINPIGSGDAVAAAVAAAIIRKLPIQELLSLAAAAGMANALTTLAGMVRIEDLDRLCPQVTIEKLA